VKFVSRIQGILKSFLEDSAFQ